MREIKLSKQSKSSQPGFTLVELMVAIAIAAVMLVGIGAALHAILVSSANSTNHALARIEVQYADSWIGDDLVQAQSVSLGSSSNGWGGFPLVISWTTPEPGGDITYSIQPMTDKLGRNLWALYRTTEIGTMRVAQNLNPSGTSCSLGFGTFGNVLVLNVASEVDTYSASASYTINPRAGNVTWTVVGISPYTLSYTAGGNGTLTGQTSQIVNYGGSGTPVTAVPNTGYHLVNWSDSSTANPRTDINVTGNVSVSASFAINIYTLTYTAGAHGNITGTSPQTVNHGDSGTTVTAVPATHYHFFNWSDGVMTALRTDTNVTHNISVTANFAIDTYTITTSPGPNGTITPANPAVGYGASQTFSITPNTGYHTVDVIVDSTNHLGAVTSYTFNNVTATHTISASFAKNTYTLTYSAGANGSISGTSPQTVNYNDSGTAVTANPATGYHFVNWSDTKTANPRTDTNVTGNISVTANFAINTYTITASACAAGGSISPSGNVLVNYGGNQTFTISPNAGAGYQIANVSVDGVSKGAIGNYTFGNVTANHTIAASFAANTGFLAPTINTTGSGNKAWTNPQYGYVSDNQYATSSNNNAWVSYAGFTFANIPVGASITGIEVFVEGYGSKQASVELSWNNGSSYTTSGKTTSWPSSAPDGNSTLGGTTDTWGMSHTWVQGDTGTPNTTFRVRLTQTQNGSMSLDCVRVKVYYTCTP